MSDLEQLLKMINPPRIRVTIEFEMTMDPVDGGFSTIDWNEKWIENRINNFGIPEHYKPEVISVQGHLL